ncbi:MAG: hypothetical protein GY801_12620 [bacterium]|nr:hypothetical protein [bacterium]
MSLVEIEEQIRPLSQVEKIQLIQDIAEMLKERSDDDLLQQLAMATASADPQSPGPLEAYEAATQLQTLLQEECI